MKITNIKNWIEENWKLLKIFAYIINIIILIGGIYWGTGKINNFIKINADSIKANTGEFDEVKTNQIRICEPGSVFTTTTTHTEDGMMIFSCE